VVVTLPKAEEVFQSSGGNVKLEEYLKTLQARYQAYFDTSADYSILGRMVDLYACCHVRNEKFFISRKATLGAWETNEYCLVEGQPGCLTAAKPIFTKKSRRTGKSRASQIR
jgi:hypothetical protein